MSLSRNAKGREFQIDGPARENFSLFVLLLLFIYLENYQPNFTILTANFDWAWLIPPLAHCDTLCTSGFVGV